MSLNKFLYILQSNTKSWGKTISLKDLIFAEILNTISSWKIWSYKNNAIDWLTCFSLVSRVQVSKKWILTHQPQPNNRAQLSIQQTPNLRQVQTNHQSMKSTSLCESPHRESAQHQPHAPWPPQHTSFEQSVFALSLYKSTKNLTLTISLSHLFILTIELNTRQRDLLYKPWTGNCCEPPINTRSMNTPSKKYGWELQLKALYATGSFCASSVQKLSAGITCLQRLKLKTCWLQHTL